MPRDKDGSYIYDQGAAFKRRKKANALVRAFEKTHRDYCFKGTIDGFGKDGGAEAELERVITTYKRARRILVDTIMGTL